MDDNPLDIEHTDSMFANKCVFSSSSSAPTHALLIGRLAAPSHYTCFLLPLLLSGDHHWIGLAAAAGQRNLSDTH